MYKNMPIYEDEQNTLKQRIAPLRGLHDF